MTRRPHRRRALAAVLAIPLLLAACTGDADDDAGDQGVPSFDDPPDQSAAWPIPEGRVDDAVERLGGIVEDMMDETEVPGVAVAVVHRDEVVYAEGFGVREAGSDAEVDTDTVFQIASLSKPVGATAIAGLVGDGTVAWSDTVTTYLPDFALADPWVTEHVTISDVYAHRSGLPDHAGDVLEDIGYDQAEVLRRLRYLPLDPFRGSYAYTNFGLTAGAEAAAAAAGTTWPDLLQTRLFDRIGMTRSSTTYDDFVAEDNRAAGHQKVDGEWEFVEQREPDAQAPAGGVNSTAADMAEWLRLLLADGTYDGEEVVDPDALAPVLTPQMTSTPPSGPAARASFYGLGMGIATDPAARVRYSHSGAFYLGAATTFAAVPAADVGIVVLTNAQPVGLAEAIASAFLDDVEFGGVTRDWLQLARQAFASMEEGQSRLADEDPPSEPAAPLADDAYVGTYANDYVGPVEVAAGGDGLVLIAGPAGVEMPLTHWDGNTFSTELPGENRALSAVDFSTGPDGAVTGLLVELWNDPEGTGVLTRT